ncbi:MAG: helix-turn-helix domain-containing protein [Actinomycetota bacterium]
MKSYRQQCPVTRALDVIGDRWTLVIVRDLLDGPRRFRRLRDDLDRISPTLLAERLDRLCQDDLVERCDRGYRLTERGRGLAPVIDELGRWGLAWMGAGDGSPDDAFHDHFRRLGLRFMIRPEVLPDRGFRLGVELDGERFVTEVGSADTHDRLRVRECGNEAVDVRLTGAMGAVYAARQGRVDIDELERTGQLVLDGPPALCDAVRRSLEPA